MPWTKTPSPSGTIDAQRAILNLPPARLLDLHTNTQCPRLALNKQTGLSLLSATWRHKMAKSPDEKSGVATERRLQKAIERITENKPKHPILRKRLAQGTLRLNVTSVALEAGVSRTLIGHKGCAYQTVRDKIVHARPERDAPTTRNDVIARLRVDLGETKLREKKLISKMAATLRRMVSLEATALREMRRSGREIKRRRSTGPLIGSRITASSVVPFPSDEDGSQKT
jgi:hypothetical protein